jgi:MFS family permease
MEAVSGEERTIMTAISGAAQAPRKFAALRNRDCRPYLVGAGLAMMADNIEHGITYCGLGSFFIGASMQSAMPIFAQDLGAGSAGTAYGVLLFANGAGGLIGGLLLEATGRIPPSVPGAIVSTAVYGVSTLLFAVTGNYPLALLLLLIGGVANLAAMSIVRTVVQLLAPPGDRGRVIGVYGMSASGLRFGSGVTVGLGGTLVGIHWSLARTATPSWS